MNRHEVCGEHSFCRPNAPAGASKGRGPGFPCRHLHPGAARQGRPPEAQALGAHRRSAQPVVPPGPPAHDGDRSVVAGGASDGRHAPRRDPGGPVRRTEVSGLRDRAAHRRAAARHLPALARSAPGAASAGRPHRNQGRVRVGGDGGRRHADTAGLHGRGSSSSRSRIGRAALRSSTTTSTLPAALRPGWSSWASRPRRSQPRRSLKLPCSSTASTPT
jgi:hypothetical protein